MNSSISFAPLGNQFGEYPQRQFPSALERIFSEYRSNDLYAIVDAARLSTPDILIEAGGICLFNQAASEKLGEVAPYLVPLADVPNLVRQIFTRGSEPKSLWGQEVAVLLRSDAGPEALRSHLRRFTQISDTVGKQHFLRFYDPLTLHHILNALQSDSARFARWFWHRGKRVVSDWIIPDEMYDQLEFIPAPPRCETSKSFLIDESYRAIFDRVVVERLARKISKAVHCTVGNPFDLSPEDWSERIRKTTALCRSEGMVSPRAIGHVAGAVILANGKLEPHIIQQWISSRGTTAYELREAKILYSEQRKAFDEWRRVDVFADSAQIQGDKTS